MYVWLYVLDAVYVCCLFGEKNKLPSSMKCNPGAEQKEELDFRLCVSQVQGNNRCSAAR